MAIKEEPMCSYTDKKRSISIGNKILYNFCKQYSLVNKPVSINALADEIWLIGRAYAASPERRSYGKSFTKKAGFKLKKGEGLGSFFYALSTNIINDKDFVELCKEIKKIRNEKYKFINDKDKGTLEASIKLVLDFNRILRKNVQKCDQDTLNAFSKKRPSLRNFISFSSKFMHFHLPNIVFIIDDFSSKQSKQKEKSDKKNYVYNLENKDKIKISVDSSDFELSIYPNNSEYDNSVADKNNISPNNYVSHVKRCYAIMCELHKKTKNKITPRMVDNFVMHANKDK